LQTIDTPSYKLDDLKAGTLKVSDQATEKGFDPDMCIIGLPRRRKPVMLFVTLRMICTFAGYCSVSTSWLMYSLGPKETEVSVHFKPDSDGVN
jgi:hypothetical protein